MRSLNNRNEMNKVEKTTTTTTSRNRRETIVTDFFFFFFTSLCISSVNIFSHRYVFDLYQRSTEVYEFVRCMLKRIFGVGRNRRESADKRTPEGTEADNEKRQETGHFKLEQ